MSYSKDIQNKAQDVAAQLKLLSNPNRLMIVCRLLDEELSVGDIEDELGIRQPTLSRELGHLRDANIISPRRQSKVVFYTLTDEPMRALIEAICAASLGTAPKPHVTRGEKPNIIGFNPRPKFIQTGRAGPKEI